MVSVTKGSFLIPLLTAGAISIIGSMPDLFITGEIAPLRAAGDMDRVRLSGHAA
ncbi:MAG: hypothetical protein JOY71_24725 [Acetobacteraceae bacterium]|nr:hypothetical protein [Acetobacteraceae bacterium]